MSRPEPVTGLRIVTQYLRRDVRIYEIKCAEGSLGLHISHDDTAAAANSWRVEAFGAGGPAIATESGTTRVAALQAVGETWTAKAQTLGLYSFDWTAVAALLRTVRAIEQ
jgi:hypothetical protein